MAEPEHRKQIQLLELDFGINSKKEYQTIFPLSTEGWKEYILDCKTNNRLGL